MTYICINAEKAVPLRPMKPIKRIIFILTCLGTSIGIGAEVYTVETVPSPKDRGQEYYVSNPDAILSAEVADTLDAMLRQLNHATNVELAVVALDQYADSQYDTYTFALALFNYWGIGEADKNTGVLVFLARKKRDIQIITGSGIEGILTDSKCREVIDHNIHYLGMDNFDQGILHICEDLSDILMDDKNRAELMLGWKPKSTVSTHILMWLCIIGFLLMVWFSTMAYQRLNGKPGQTAEDIQDQSENLQTFSGCMAFMFPIPFIFFYLFYRFARKHVKSVPINCPQCGALTTLMPEEERAAKISSLLRKQEQVEDKLQSYKYVIWHCPQCEHNEIDKRKGAQYSTYRDCPECGARAMKERWRITTVEPTFSEDGEQLSTQTCLCCNYTQQVPLKVDRLSVSMSRGSGGHHGSHRSGSFGGGHSSGGGAGGHF